MNRRFTLVNAICVNVIWTTNYIKICKITSDIDFVVLFRYGTTKRSHILEYLTFAKMSSFALCTPTIFSFALFL